MAPMDRIWACITYVLHFVTFSPFEIDGTKQRVILPSTNSQIHKSLDYPIFKPPGGRLQGPGSNFSCEYPAMVGWSPCSTENNRRCWLKHDVTGQEYNISTNYEDTDKTPIGIHRTYYLNLTDGSYDGDGMNFQDAKLFNNSYPGPWIQGCWGDNITVIVQNKLKYNGTSVHWHGIRQWLTMHMDGVNGVTQCPIAPGDSFNYTFRAMQYGSAWYHSHYSVQYADGAAGPLTLHGPTYQPYDEAKTPLLMTDWGHNSAFAALYGTLLHPSILLNGNGSVTRYYNKNKNTSMPRDPYTIHFEDPVVDIGGGKTRPKRFLMRIINTSFDSTFVFSIDNHHLMVVGADFVPIHNYTTTSVLVGIGQRYHVIVEADPDPAGGPLPKDGNYWIRTWKASCFRFEQPDPKFPEREVSAGYEKTGILRYDLGSSATPTTKNWTVPLACSDEPYESLIPVIPWKVDPPANVKPEEIGQNFSIMSDFKKQATMFPFAHFSMGGDESFMPMRVDYDNPTFLNLDSKAPWNPQWVVLPENFSNGKWVYLVVKGHKIQGTSGAHPIHLHGHDFAILQQNEKDKWPININLTLNNPPRRDVVLLPTGGYIVIAFKTDNPGAWLVHCHIASHAGMGLAMQIMERQGDAAKIWPNDGTSHALNVTKEGCRKWNNWWGNCTNWWVGKDQAPGSSCELGGIEASPDSGI